MSIGIGLGLRLAVQRVVSGIVASAFQRGHSATYNAGTDGDLFVSPSGDDSTGDGSIGSPYLTIGKAITEATSGDVVRVRTGTYRETVTMKAGVDVKRYGTEQPKITGADVLSGLTACVSGDATYVGANWASMYKSGEIALSSLPTSDARAAFLHENGVPLQLAVARPENPEHPIHLDAPKDWHTASAVNLDGSGFIESYELAEVTDAYSDAELEAASIAFQGNPNLGYFDDISDVTAGVITLATSGTYTPSSATAIKDNFMIVNLLPAMAAGGWGYRIVGSNVIFYVWPNDVANVTSGIEYTTRQSAVIMADDSELVGFEVVQTCSYDASNPGNGGHAIQEATSTKTSDVAVRHCNIHSHMRVGTRGYAPVYLRNVDDAVVEQNTIEGIYGMFGTFIQGGSFSNMGENQTGQSVDWSMRPLLRRNLYENVGHSPMRVFVSRDGAAMHNQCGQSGFAAHANKANCYQYCHNWLWFGNDFTGADGYLTFQDSSAIHWIANYVVASFEGVDGRGIIDQNAFTNQTPAEAFTLDGTCYFLNNHFAPYAEAISAPTYDSVTLGRYSLHPEVDFDLRNNIWYGVDIDNVALEVARSNNYDTRGISDTTTSVAATYEDAASGDLTVKSDAPMRGVTGSSIAAALTSITSTMSQVTASDLLLDVNGAAFDTTSPPIGPATGMDVVTQEVPALNPTVSGAAIEAETLTASDALIYKQPRPTASSIWQVETGGAWTDVVGATGSTLVLDADDIGKRARRKTSTAAGAYYSDPTAAITAAASGGGMAYLGGDIANGNTAYTVPVSAAAASGNTIVVFAMHASTGAIGTLTANGLTMTERQGVVSSGNARISVYDVVIDTDAGFDVVINAGASWGARGVAVYDAGTTTFSSAGTYATGSPAVGTDIAVTSSEAAGSGLAVVALLPTGGTYAFSADGANIDTLDANDVGGYRYGALSQSSIIGGAGVSYGIRLDAQFISTAAIFAFYN